MKNNKFHSIIFLLNTRTRPRTLECRRSSRARTTTMSPPSLDILCWQRQSRSRVGWIVKIQPQSFSRKDQVLVNRTTIHSALSRQIFSVFKHLSQAIRLNAMRVHNDLKNAVTIKPSSLVAMSRGSLSHKEPEPAFRIGIKIKIIAFG